MGNTITGFSICAGVGGLDLGLRLALGDQLRTVGYAERESHAATILLARTEEATLDPAPVWIDDIQDLDGKPWRGSVDIVFGGIPCQPWSYVENGPWLEGWRDALDTIQHSPFLRGEKPGSNGHPPFIPSLEFFLRETSIIKILEGKYKHDDRLMPIAVHEFTGQV